MKNIHAHTETTTSAPGYISINEEAGRLSVSVRTRGGQVPSLVEVTRDELEALHRDVGAYLAATAPAPAPVEAPVEEVKEAPKGKKKDA